MEHTTSLGRSSLKVPRMGMGAMTWGQPSGFARWTPAQLAYGPSHGADEEQQALEVSLAAISLFHSPMGPKFQNPVQFLVAECTDDTFFPGAARNVAEHLIQEGVNLWFDVVETKI